MSEEQSDETIEELDEALDGGERIRCWCGVVGTYEELFDDDGLDSDCGGTGYVDCYCGGDLCVCHHHGQQVDCPGCDSCPVLDDGFDDDYYDSEE